MVTGRTAVRPGYTHATLHNTIAIAFAAMLVVIGTSPLGAQSLPPARPLSDETGLTAGIRIGVNVATLSTEEQGGSRTGIVAGAWIGHRLSGVLGLQLEGLYSAKGDVAFDTTFAIDYLEVPLLVTVKPADTSRLRPVFFTGPGVEFKLRTRYGDVQNSSFQAGFNDFVHGHEFEWVIGGGLDAPYGRRHVTLDVRYSFGLTPVFDADPTDSDSEKRNRVFAILAGYRFR
jgi:hypothetical protein